MRENPGNVIPIANSERGWVCASERGEPTALLRTERGGGGGTTGAWNTHHAAISPHFLVYVRGDFSVPLCSAGWLSLSSPPCAAPPACLSASVSPPSPPPPISVVVCTQDFDLLAHCVNARYKFVRTHERMFGGEILIPAKRTQKNLNSLEIFYQSIFYVSVKFTFFF